MKEKNWKQAGSFKVRNGSSIWRRCEQYKMNQADSAEVRGPPQRGPTVNCHITLVRDIERKCPALVSTLPYLPCLPLRMVLFYSFQLIQFHVFPFSSVPRDPLSGYLMKWSDTLVVDMCGELSALLLAQLDVYNKLVSDATHSLSRMNLCLMGWDLLIFIFM